MRVRLPFAGAFFLLCLLTGYAGLSSLQVAAVFNDKFLHFSTFFVLTTIFYWVVDTSRRRTLNLTLSICTALLGVGSEFLGAILPNGHEFDVFDVVANVVGSLAALGLCSLYHKRMLARKRDRKTYGAVSGEDVDDDADVELGVMAGSSGHEEGIIANARVGTSDGSADRTMTLEQEVSNWDENGVDTWEDDLGDDRLKDDVRRKPAGMKE